MTPATLDIGPSLVANHLRFAPADEVIIGMERLGQATANVIGTHLDLSTRDVVATLNVLAAHRSVYVYGGFPDRARLAGADLAVHLRADGTGEVVRDQQGMPRIVSAAEMAVLCAHRHVERSVGYDVEQDRDLPAVWSLA